MADITIHTSNNTGVTCVSNAFIDNYMSDANGEFVKIYIYLLRLLGQEGVEIDISTLADKLDHTERDINRALSYWEEQKLLSLEYNSNKELVGICFNEPTSGINSMSSNISPKGKMIADFEIATKNTLPIRKDLGPAEIKEFKKDNNSEEMLFVLETYLGRNLSMSDINAVYYWTKELNFSTELVYYLAEYCIDKGHPNIKYMDSIAIDWAEHGISTIEEAKEDTLQHSEAYYNICKSFGISDRSLIKSELDYLSKWKKYNFNPEIIEEACRRTIVNTNKPNFEYADKILSNWANNKVATIDDIKALDEEFNNNNKNTKKAKPSTTKNNKFNNFDAREYDYDKLMKTLANQ